MVNNRDWNSSNQYSPGDGSGSHGGDQHGGDPHSGSSHGVASHGVASHGGQEVYGGGDYYGQDGAQHMPPLPQLPQEAQPEQSAAAFLGFDEAAQPEDTPPEDTKKRRGIIWVVAILAVLLLGAGGAWLVFFNNATEAADTVFNFDSQQRGPAATESSGIEIPLVDNPSETVREYVTAIAEGDASGAGAYVDPGAPLASGDALSIEALGSAQSRISVQSVELIEEQGGSANVQATMSLAGEQFEHIFELNLVDTEIDGKTSKTWSIREPLVAAISVSATGLETVSIGEQEVGIDPNGSSQLVYVYPGVYSVTANAGEYFSVSGGKQQVSVTTPGNTNATVHFSAAPNAAFEQAVLSQVQDRVSLCTQVPGNMDEECPSITRNTQLEELTVTQTPAGFDSISATSFVSSRGEIGVVDTPTSGNPKPSQRTSLFNVYGDISIVNGYPEISNVYCY